MKKTIKANTLADILTLDKTPNEYGEPGNAWTIIFSGVYVEYAPILGREFILARSVASDVTAKVRCRWFDGVKPDMRILINGVSYDILSVIDVDFQHRELLMYVRMTEVVSNEPGDHN